MVRRPVWLLFLLLFAGCDGCQHDADPTDLPRPAESRPEFESRSPKSFPTQRADNLIEGETGAEVFARGAPDGMVKPGHWTAVSLTLQSNRQDRRGTLQTEIVPVRTNNVVNGPTNVQPEPEMTPIKTRRPVTLPKGQRRRIDTRLLVPDRGIGGDSSFRFAGTFTTDQFESNFPTQPALFGRLASETYFVVILTDRPQKFVSWQDADWVKPYKDELSMTSLPPDYQVVIPPTDGIIPISETSLDWTSTAVVVWDNLPARSLTPAQRDALTDWVHFGGTLVCNGPAALDGLVNDPLGKLLPISETGNAELELAAVRPWIESTKIATDPSLADVENRFQSGQQPIALDGPASDRAESIGEGELVFRSAVGRGSVIQSRMDLTAEWISRWDSFDSFVNAVLLGRPARRFEDRTRRVYVDTESIQATAAVNTQLRYLARDDRLLSRSSPSMGGATSESSRYAIDPVSGLGGWKDDSTAIGLFRELLERESGVTIPKSSLVLRGLSLYLFLLIPVNYLVFRFMGRLEWAWWAVVPISLLGVIAIARAAQLDVGFVRSRNELAILELQPRHPRGHLTRVIGLYNSLSSTYDLSFEKSDVAMGVIESRRDDGRHSGVFGESPPLIRLGAQSGPILEDVNVGSNSIRFIHVEQIMDVGGDIVLSTTPVGTGQVEHLTNRSELEFLDAFVVERPIGEPPRYAVVGGLSPSEKFALRWSVVPENPAPADLPMQVGRMMNRLLDPASMAEGESRVVARVDGVLDEMKITPEVSQFRGQTVVVANLRFPKRPEPRPDVNRLSDFPTAKENQTDD